MGVVVRRNSDFVAHSGVEGMKWGYNDGKRNGKRTAAELNKLVDLQKQMAKTDQYVDVSTNIQGDYDKANYMLRYLGISLDNHSDDASVVRTMAVYKHMAATKDNYKNQYDWLKAFTRTLSNIGYDMKSVEQNIDKNKGTLQTLKSGGGSDPSDSQTSSSNDDFAEAYKKNKVTREAVKKHDKEVAKESSKKTSSKKEDEEETLELETQKEDEKKKKSVKHSENQNEEDLYHHGILGQKWGVRRFQNKDGSLTDAGRKHYGYKEEVSKMSDAELRNTLNRKRLESRYKDLKVGSSRSVRQDVETASKNASSIAKRVSGENSNASKGTKLAGKVAKDTAKLADKTNSKINEKAKADIDLSSYDNETLQKEVNRMQMEKDLIDLMKKETKSGSKITKEALRDIGDIVETAVDVATLAAFSYPFIKKALKKVGPIGVKYILLN